MLKVLIDQFREILNVQCVSAKGKFDIRLKSTRAATKCFFNYEVSEQAQ